MHHALGVVGGKQKERQPHALFGAHVQHLQFFQRAQDQRVGLRPGVNDVDRRGVFQHAPEQAQESGLAFVLVAELIRADGLRVTAGKGVMPVVKVGAVPRHAEPVEPGGAEFGFKTFAEIAFGLRI